MKQKFTSSERRGLILLLIAVTAIIGVVIWQRRPAAIPDPEPVAAETADTIARRGEQRAHSGKKSRSAPQARPRKRAKATGNGPERSPLDQPVN